MFKIIDGETKAYIKTEFSSSADLCARIDMIIRPSETKVIPLGVIIDLERVQQSYFNHVNTQNEKAGLPPLAKATIESMWVDFQKSSFFALKIRSSLSFELNIANGEGEIDIDYPKEIGLIVHNPLRLKEGTNEIDFDRVVEIKAGSPVAQIKLAPHLNFLMGDEYRLNKKRTDGFGSTDKIYNDHPESCKCEECQDWQDSYNKRNNTTF